jgi:HK97 family phage major capsid protein/HK97 family phage prohead protease
MKPKPGEVEQRSAPDAALTVEGNTLHGLIPFSIESRDLGGWKEIIDPGALDNADLSDLVATANHTGIPLGRFDSTLTVESRSDGLAWSVDLGDGPTAQDVKAAVQRGDLRESSWRMVVGKDKWTGSTRHVEEIRSLRDVAVVTTGAYPAESTRVEVRERPDAPIETPPEAAKHQEEAPVKTNRENGGGLTVEDRNAEPSNTVETRILDAMAAVPKGESRDLTHATTEPIEPPELAGYVWQKLRERSIVLASGVPIVATERKSLKVPTLTGDMTADFYAELEEIVESDIDLDEVDLEPKAIKGLARGSSEAFEDADPDLLTLVQNNLTAVMGLKFDGQALSGTAGSKAFAGMTKWSGVQTLEMNYAAFSSWDPIIAAVGLLQEAEVPGPYAIAMHPRVATGIERLKAFETAETNIPLARPTGIPPIFTSKQVGLTAAKESKPDWSPVIVYAPQSLICVRRRDVTIEVDRSQEFDHDAVFVRGRARAVLGAEHEEAVVVINHVKSPAITLP